MSATAALLNVVALALAASGASPVSEGPRELDFRCVAVGVDGKAFAFVGEERGRVVRLGESKGTPLEGFTFTKIENGEPGRLTFSGTIAGEAWMIALDLDPWSTHTPELKITRYDSPNQTRLPISVATGFCRAITNGEDKGGESAKVAFP